MAVKKAGSGGNLDIAAAAAKGPSKVEVDSGRKSQKKGKMLVMEIGEDLHKSLKLEAIEKDSTMVSIVSQMLKARYKK